LNPSLINSFPAIIAAILFFQSSVPQDISSLRVRAEGGDTKAQVQQHRTNVGLDRSRATNERATGNELFSSLAWLRED